MTGPQQPGNGYDQTRPVAAGQTPAATSPPAGAGAPGGVQGLPPQSSPPAGIAPTAPQPGAGGQPETLPARRGVAYTTYAITVLVLLIAIAVVVFVVQNDERVSIWLFGSTHVMSVAGALAASAAAGLVIGLLIGVIPQVRLRRELRHLRRENRTG